MERLEAYKKRLADKEALYHQRQGQYQQLVTQQQLLERTVTQLKDQNLQWEATRVLLQQVASDARESARLRLQETVTNALQFVFGPDFQFEIELKESRGRTEAEFYVVSDYNGTVVKTKPEEARGGGVVDIIAIALRVALIQIYNAPNICGPIALDEPGKHVSADYAVKLGMFLKKITQAFGRQIILVTHQPDIQSIADKSFEVELKGGKSVVKEAKKAGGKQGGDI